MSRRIQTNEGGVAIAMNPRKWGRTEEFVALAAVMAFSTLVAAIYIATLVASVGG